MSSTHTTWQGAVDKSNATDRKRVASKYKGVKKIGAKLEEFNSEADPFMENDPILSMAPERSHNLEQYTKASGMPKAKAKRLLKSTGTLQK
jgi:hypothetical protein